MFKKKLAASRRKKRSKKNSKKNSGRFAAKFVQKKIKPRSKKNAASRPICVQKKIKPCSKKMPLLGWFVFKKINKSCSKNAVSRPICLQKSRFGRKKTFATISVVISSSSWLLRAMDPCRLLLDFKNRLFAPSKKNYHVQKRTIPSKISALRAFKKKLSASKKNSALRAEAFKKKFKKKLQPLRGWFRSKKNSKTFKKKLGASRRRSKKNSKIVFFWTDLFKKKHCWRATYWLQYNRSE